MTFTATVAAVSPGAGLPTGSVTFMVGATTLGVGTLDAGGQASFATAGLSVAGHLITAVYGGDVDFTTSTSAAVTQTVNQASTTTTLLSSVNPSVFGQSVTFTATVAPVSPGAGLPTGSVTFMDGAATLGTGTLDAGGQASLTTTALSVTGHSITAVYGGDLNFVTSTSTAVTQTVNQASTTTTLLSSVNPSSFGQSVTFTATVAAVSPGAGLPTGSVTFMDGAATLGTGTLDVSGQASFTTTALSVTGHSITAVYGGDVDFTTSNSTVLTQTVDQAGTTTTLLSSVNPSVFGQPVTFTATVAAVSPGAGLPTGSVTFMDGATTLGTGTLDASGQANFTTAALSVAGHSITAIYGGDVDFVASTSPALTQTVDQASTTTTLLSSVNPSVFGQSVTFTATVAAVSPGVGLPTGSVTFMDGATTLGTGTLDAGGQASFTTTALSVAGHSITAVYGSDFNFVTSTSSALTQTVNQGSTATTLLASVNPSVFGQSVTFTATVAAVSPGVGLPTGSVTFMDGATTLGTGTLDAGGQASFTTTALSVAGHSITAVYGGDFNFVTSTSSTLTQTVNQASTTTTLLSSVSPSVFGQSVTFTATVAAVSPGAGLPTGSVTFMDGATTLGTGTLDASGQTNFTTAALSVAGHSITVVYGGDVNFTTSTSTLLTQAIDQASTTTTLLSSVNPSVFGQSVTFTATVVAVSPGVGLPTGSVTFIDGATMLGMGTLDAGGQASFTTAALSVAGHSITAVYGGDFNFVTSTSSALTQTVNQASTTTTLLSSVNPSVFGQSVTFTATVAAVSPGVGLPTGSVTFMDRATTLGTGTLDASGQASFTTTALSVAGHTITAIYAGDVDFTTSTSAVLTHTVNQASTTTTLLSSVNPSVFGQSVTFTATVADVSPGTGLPTGSVTFMDGAATLGAGTLDASGQASFTTTALSVTGHSITAVYGGDFNFVTSTSSALTQTVDQASTTTMLLSSVNPSVFGQSVTFTATVTTVSPGAGLPTGSVTIMDGATTLGVGTLDASGQASFTTAALSVAGHTITVVYGGDADFVTSASAELTQNVSLASTTTALISTVSPSVSGQSVSFTATVTAISPGAGLPTGSVTFMDGATVLGTGALDANGEASFTTAALDVASHSITAAYESDGQFAISTSTILTQVVGQAGSNISMTSSIATSVVGQSITFTATVVVESPGAGQPMGEVTFMDGTTILGTSTLDSHGQTAYTTATLAVSGHTITAVYSGNTQVAGGSSAELIQIVNPASPVALSPTLPLGVPGEIGLPANPLLPAGLAGFVLPLGQMATATLNLNRNDSLLPLSANGATPGSGIEEANLDTGAISAAVRQVVRLLAQLKVGGPAIASITPAAPNPAAPPPAVPNSTLLNPAIAALPAIQKWVSENQNILASLEQMDQEEDGSTLSGEWSAVAGMTLSAGFVLYNIRTLYSLLGVLSFVTALRSRFDALGALDELNRNYVKGSGEGDEDNDDERLKPILG